MKQVLYDESVLDVLSDLSPMKALMLLDYFETHYEKASLLKSQGKVFKTGSYRFLFIETQTQIQVLRLMK